MAGRIDENGDSGTFKRASEFLVLLWVALLFSVVILFGYGGALLSLLVYKVGISWSGHFFGFLSGVMAAWWTRSKKMRIEVAS